MSDAVMNGDGLAAHNLLLALGMEPTEAVIRQVSEHMQAHRLAAERFQALRGRDDLMAHLETAFLERRHPDDGAWSAGYAAAEHEALAWASARTQAIAPRSPASTGSVLRAMIRERKRTGAAVVNAPVDRPKLPPNH